MRKKRRRRTTDHLGVSHQRILQGSLIGAEIELVDGVAGVEGVQSVLIIRVAVLENDRMEGIVQYRSYNGSFHCGWEYGSFLGPRRVEKVRE